MFCQKCGVVLQDDSRFCFQCGAPIVRQADAPQPVPPVPPVQPV